ncbi:MAG: hypothetical protein SGPRY_002329 [Prymnesium sp.]
MSNNNGHYLYIKWPSCATNKSVPLEALEKDTNGASLGLYLKNFEGASPPPVVYEPTPKPIPRRRRNADGH